MGAILGMIIIGLIAGYAARALVPGRQEMGLGRTFLLGVVGSFVGGFLGYLIFNKDLSDGPLQASGILGSIVGAVIALLVYERFINKG